MTVLQYTTHRERAEHLPADTAASLRSGRLPRSEGRDSPNESLPSERGKQPERGEAAVFAS